jgi:hypothetical protein
MRRNTSIFSNKYHKREKRRRFIKKLFIFILIIAALVLLFRKPILEMVEKVKQDIAQEKVQKEEILDQIPETVTNEEIEEPVEEEPVIVKQYVMAELPIEKEVSLEIVEENGEMIFAPFSELEGMEGDISPSMNQAVILDQETQDLFLIDLDGTVTDITYKIYKNTRGYTNSKENILNSYDEFVWAEQPKFLDEDTVVYMSQLPWFDDRRFLYVVDLMPLSHRNFQSVFGRDVVLGERTEMGLSFTKEGRTYYLTPDYKIIQE